MRRRSRRSSIRHAHQRRHRALPRRAMRHGRGAKPRAAVHDLCERAPRRDAAQGRVSLRHGVAREALQLHARAALVRRGAPLRRERRGPRRRFALFRRRRRPRPRGARRRELRPRRRAGHAPALLPAERVAERRGTGVLHVEAQRPNQPRPPRRQVPAVARLPRARPGPRPPLGRPGIPARAALRALRLRGRGGRRRARRGPRPRRALPRGPAPDPRRARGAAGRRVAEPLAQRRYECRR